MNPTRQWLELLAANHADYENGALSPARFVLERGIDFEFSPLPRHIRLGTPRQCFANALEIALAGRGRYVYVEGYATSVIPVPHAWVYDRAAGAIFDPTWEEGFAYLGVPLKARYVLGVVRRTAMYGALQNYREEYPIESGAHPEASWFEPLDVAIVPPIGANGANRSRTRPLRRNVRKTNV